MARAPVHHEIPEGLEGDAGDAQREKDSLRARQRAAQPELARAVRERRSRKADGDVHSVDRRVARSRNQEAAAVPSVDRGPVRRWRRADALAALPAPEGYHIEYVRRDNTSRGDEANLIAHIQEGWEFARKSDFPEHTLPTQRLSDHGEVIGNASVILMKLPLELKAQRDAFYNGKRDAITRAINRRNPGLDEANRKMPLVEDVNEYSHEFERTRVRRARRQPGVAPD